ncbi:MAG: hypothetical protein JWL90_4503 [Chthoniobacteraceae bacterium]|nr:hypothetical protein [Chthoniobacteraceae bacterium]
MSIPYPPVIAAITVNNAAAALEFYKAAFDAVERYRLTDSGSGKIGHAEFTISGQVMMIADEFPAFNKSPSTLGGSATKFVLIVANADAAFERAIAAGAIAIRPPSDEFYGYRAGCVKDPFGHEWMVQHEIEKVAPAEMQRRWDAMMETGAGDCA